MMPPSARRYILTALGATPRALAVLLGSTRDEAAFWDQRPDPARFTPREVAAHLADWDEIFLERLRRTLTEDNPVLPDRDEGALAAERDYASRPPSASLARFAAGRSALVTYARGFDEAQWQRPAARPELGPMSAEAQLVLILAHDGYHMEQLLALL